MPVIAGPSSQPAPRGKVSVNQIIEMVNKRTERRGEKTLDMRAELLGVIQEFCQEHRWFWRRKSVILNTLADGTYQYDLTDTGGANIADFEQISQAAPKIFTSGGVYLGKLQPEFDPDQQDILAEDQSSGQPSCYWITGPSTLNVYPKPNGVFRIRIPYWANPAMTPEEMDDVVPLVPPNLYRILIKGLERQVLRYTLGEGSAKYLAAKTEYEELVLKSAMKEDFAPGNYTEWRNQDSNDAVQSS
jgi:hypothetical protein